MKDIAFQLRMPIALHEKMQEKAKECGLTVSGWTRMRLMELVGEVPPVKTKRARTEPGAITEPSSVAMSAYVDGPTRSIKRICSYCGTESENWGYDMGGKVRCRGCG